MSKLGLACAVAVTIVGVIAFADHSKRSTAAAVVAAAPVAAVNAGGHNGGNGRSFEWRDQSSGLIAAGILERRLRQGDSLAECEMASLQLYCRSSSEGRRLSSSLTAALPGASELARSMADQLARKDAYCVGVSSELSDVLDNFRKSAISGNFHAQDVYLSGVLLPEDGADRGELHREYLEEAERLALDSVRQGNSNVAFMLADAYAGRREARGLLFAVSRNPSRSRALYEMLLSDRERMADVESGISTLALKARIAALDAQMPAGGWAGSPEFRPALGSYGSLLNVSKASNPLASDLWNCN